MNQFVQIKKLNNDTLEVRLDGVFGENPKTGKLEVIAEAFKAINKHAGIKKIDLYVNSNGGDLLEADKIYKLLKAHPAYITAYVEKMAASASTYILAACNRIVMDISAKMHLHFPFGEITGDAKDLREAADELEELTNKYCKAILSRPGCKLTKEKLLSLMAAETTLTAKRCFELGLCDAVKQPAKQAKQGNSDNTPARMLAALFKHI